MSSHKEPSQGGKRASNFSLEEELTKLSNKDLYELIQTLIQENPDVYRLILEWFKQRIKGPAKGGKKEEMVFLNDELLMEYWENAESIVSEFNEYGGGSENEEREAYEWLGKILDLIKEGNISPEAKFDFLDDAFVQYDIGNSGFEDTLVEIFFGLCQIKEEWKYLVEKLERQPSTKHPSGLEWREELIMDIYKNYLLDDQAYLTRRLKKLHYGMDYWDLVDFYISRDKMKEAIQAAERGILKGEGRVTELFGFLFDHFAKNEDTVNLERIANTAITRKQEEKNMLDRLFEYYRAQGDYQKAKGALIKSFQFVEYGRYYQEYKTMRKFLKEFDWKEIEPKILRETKRENLHDYLRICLDKNMKKVVLQTMLNPPKSKWGIPIEEDFDEFAHKLKKDFPEGIIKYYWQRVYQNISKGKRRTYRIAATYLSKVKHIYVTLLKDETKWEQRFSNLKAEFNNRPAFLDEVSEV